MADTTSLIESSSRVEITAPALEVIEGHVTTTSQQIAAHFNKAHRSVLLAIRRLECSEEFRLHNFVQTVETRENPSGGAPIQSPSYRITRDGFVFLAMGFTGKYAAQWKEAYITAFNSMERELIERSNRTGSPLDRMRLMMMIENGQITNTIQLGKWDVIVDPDNHDSIGQMLSIYLPDDMVPAALDLLHKRVARKYQMNRAHS